MGTLNSVYSRIIPAGLLLCLLLMAGTCKKKDDKKTVALANALLGKTWLHSHEDDRGDTLVYRPNTYNFPPARGRTGFTMEADGTFRQYDIAPTDGLEEHDGRWEIMNDKVLNVTFPNKKSTDFQAEVISAEPELLKVKKRYKNQ